MIRISVSAPVRALESEKQESSPHLARSRLVLCAAELMVFRRLPELQTASKRLHMFYSFSAIVFFSLEALASGESGQSLRRSCRKTPNMVVSERRRS